ncbi:unnamed protein product [Chondrus crispus]|uniref:Uncharacterized protein n=1 Tax=Chondrus crispus TaxID=2769 RepID=R7QJZ0_CHOCR|nr:unnamed protein product [Chondrus crispus]CDF38043.1 unnamed protein product [Chondrus crispus]|eukprot:XP_005717912.1 unnamed protein product [Chondrus crispus]
MYSSSLCVPTYMHTLRTVCPVRSDRAHDVVLTWKPTALF